MTATGFGMIGLGTMGRNLALNIESRGISVAVWNREPEWVDEFLGAHAGAAFAGARTLQDLVALVEKPRRLLMMIPAGAPVDSMIESLAPLLEPGDILIDGGNSWFEDTRRREAALRPTGIHFMGCGVSGGEDGARLGPSLMPGGSAEAWRRVRDVLEAIAARTEAGACVTHVGPDGAGHFVKMVHNGIEYADMQIIAECWDLLRRGLGLDAAAAGAVFEQWSAGPLESFLIELTARIARVVDSETGAPLVDMVLDKAGQKGTGRWTGQVALDLAVPVPTIAASIDARVLSSMKDERVHASSLLAGPTPWRATHEGDGHEMLVESTADALYASRVCAYAQGLALMASASRRFAWAIDLAEIARIWKGGCIIRARVLDPIRAAFGATPDLRNLLLAPEIADGLARAEGGWRRTVSAALAAGIPVPALSSALWYFDTYRTARLPQNLTQAQRDAFGAHTYERLDRPGAVHSDW